MPLRALPLISQRARIAESPINKSPINPWCEALACTAFVELFTVLRMQAGEWVSTQSWLELNQGFGDRHGSREEIALPIAHAQLSQHLEL